MLRERKGGADCRKLKPKPAGLLERRFELGARGSDLRTEILAGVTTFLTMAYIVLVNPAILGQAGMPVAAVAAATCLAAGFASILMGFERQHAARAGAGHGAQRLFQPSPSSRRDGRALAGGAGLRLHLGRRLPAADLRRHPPADHRRDPAASVRGGGGRHRPVHRLHRPQECRHRRLQPGDLGRARRSPRARRGAGACSAWSSSPRWRRGRCAARS